MKFTKENVFKKISDYVSKEIEGDDLYMSVQYMEEEKISNAMQAVKWLEEGKEIINEDKKVYTRIKDFILLKNNHNVQLTISTLLQSRWQLYKEPKYEKVEYINALKIYLENPAANIKAYFSHEDEEYTLQENDVDGLGLYNANLNDSVTLSTEIIKSAEWRRYEDFIEHSPL